MISAKIMKYSTEQVMMMILILFLHDDFVDTLYNSVICDGNKIIIKANMAVINSLAEYIFTGMSALCSAKAGT